MYKGKYTQKRRRRPALWAALALALVLTLSVGGTVAYLLDSTGSVTNTFTPAEAKVEIDETFDGKEKTSITVENTGNIPVYVRVTLVASYHKDNGDVCGTHTAELTSPILSDGDYNKDDWVKGEDGYYYYKTAVAANSSTNDLLGANKSIRLDEKTGCCKMHVDVFAQAIQAQPDNAVEQAWKVKLDSNGNITVAASNN